MAKLPQGEELKRRCEELGIDTEVSEHPAYPGSQRATAPDDELQRRLLEGERALRESRLWMLALISAIASVVSAVTAIIAVVAN